MAFDVFLNVLVLKDEVRDAVRIWRSVLLISRLPEAIEKQGLAEASKDDGRRYVP